MKPVAQTKDFCTCLHGYTLPKYSIYGNVYGTTYYCTDFLTPVKINGRDVYHVHIFCPAKKNPGRGSWQVTYTDDCKNGGAIFVHIRDFVKSADFIAEKPIFCQHRVAKAQELERAAEKATRDIKRSREKAAREWWRDNMMDAPRMKRPQGATGTYLPTYSQSAVDGMGYSLDYEYNYHEYVGFGDDPTINPALHRSDKPFFENGQNTSGELAFMVKRDGMKTCFKDYRPEKKKPNAVKSAKENSTLNKVKVERALSSQEELYYYLANSSEYSKEVCEELISIGKIPVRFKDRFNASCKKHKIEAHA